MEENSKLHALPTLLPRGKSPRCPLHRMVGEAKRELAAPIGNANPTAHRMAVSSLNVTLNCFFTKCSPVHNCTHRIFCCSYVRMTAMECHKQRTSFVYT